MEPGPRLVGPLFAGSHSLEEYLGRSQPEGNVGGN